MSDSPHAEIIAALEKMKRIRQVLCAERLRHVLAQVEHGEVCAVAIATVGPDLSTGSAFTLGDKTLAELLGRTQRTACCGLPSG